MAHPTRILGGPCIPVYTPLHAFGYPADTLRISLCRLIAYCRLKRDKKISYIRQLNSLSEFPTCEADDAVSAGFTMVIHEVVIGARV